MYVCFNQVVDQLKKFQNSIALKYKLLLKGEIQMIDMYVALIIAGRRTLPQVPTTFRGAVEADLNAIGLDGNGGTLVTE